MSPYGGGARLPGKTVELMRYLGSMGFFVGFRDMLNKTVTRRAVWLCGYVTLGALLLILSSPRVVGDGEEYLAVAENLSRLEKPSLTAAQASAHGLSSTKSGGSDGRQDVVHFWVYPAIVAPPLAAARWLGVPAPWAFATVNATLLLIAGWTLLGRMEPALAGLILLSPIIWWADKVHTEVFTFSLVLIGLCRYHDSPRTAIVLFGLASTQNPPIIAGALLMAVTAVTSRRLSIGMVIPAVAVAVGLAALHPLYYYSRIERWSPLVEGELRIPGLQAFGFALWDPNVGILFNYPWLIIAMVLSWRLRPKGALRADEQWIAGLCGAIWLFSFAQTWNFNHGGTPGMSRYALWLIPLAFPFLLIDPRRSRAAYQAIRVTAICGIVWSIGYFRPNLPENHLQPTRVAEWLWARHPGVHNPLPEIFAERLRHEEMAHPLAATANCSKALLFEGQWPSHCIGTRVPVRCLTALCYANKTSKGYEFVVTSRRGGTTISSVFD